MKHGFTSNVMTAMTLIIAVLYVAGNINYLVEKGAVGMVVLIPANFIVFCLWYAAFGPDANNKWGRY